MKRYLALVLTACAVVVYPSVAQASATFSLLLPYQVSNGETASNLAAFRLNLTTGAVSSADIDMSAVTNDPVFSSSAPIRTLQTIVPLPAPFDTPQFMLLHMDAVAPTFSFFDSGNLLEQFGAGSFSIGLPGATATDPVTLWVNGAFTHATLSVNLQRGTGVFFGDATYSGFSYDPAAVAGGLSNPGSFVFALSDQQFFENLNVMQYSINPGALDAQPVPEPATLTLVGLGLAAAVRRRIAARQSI